MKTLITVALSLAFLLLTARSVRAQNPCCGNVEEFHASCGSNCSIIITTCDEGGDEDVYAVVVSAACGSCTRVQEYAPAGYCDDGIVRSVAGDSADTSDGTSIYVNAYVKNCKGQYSAVRMAMARQGG